MLVLMELVEVLIIGLNFLQSEDQ